MVREPAKPVFAMFAHHGSRAHDPQEHKHTIAMNAAIDADGNGGTLEMSGVWRRKKEFGAVMRSFEARALQRAGFTVERDGESYRIVMFGREVEKHISKGAEKIREAVGPNASAAAKGAAALSVRGSKTAEDPAVADRRWKDEIYAASGLDSESIDESLGKTQELSSVEAAPRFDLSEIIDLLSDKGPLFREQDLRTAISIASQGIYDVEIEELVAMALRDERLVAVYASQIAGPWMTRKGGFAELTAKDQKVAEQSYADWSFKNPGLAQKHSLPSYVVYVQERWQTDNKALAAETIAASTKQIGWTTRETLHADRELARYVGVASNTRLHAINREIVNKCVAEFEAIKLVENPSFKISEQQHAAIYHATTEGDLAIVEGVAGAGKSTFLYSVARSYEAAGYRVIGLNFQSTNAADLGKDAEIESITIDKFIGMTRQGPRRPGEERLEINAKTVLILDEAGQVGGAKMHQVQRIIEAAGGKLLMSGHTAQMQAIAGTAAMKLMREVAGEGKSAWITETQRQIDKDHGEALTKLSEGDAVAALVKHAADGKFSIVDGEGFEAAAAAYHQQVEEVGVDRAFVLCDTNAAMRRTNDEIRLTLKQAGVVAAQDFRVTLTDKRRREYDTDFSVGDRIITRTKVKHEAAVQNGIVWTICAIEEIEPGRLKIGMERADGKPLDKTGQMRVEIDTKNTKNLHLSYAMTTDLSQGKTKDAGAVLMTDASRTELSKWYVALSRFRRIPHIIASKFAIEELATLQNREITDAMDVAQAARIIVDSAEDQSKLKTHTLDPQFKFASDFVAVRETDAARVTAKEAREQQRIRMEKAGEAKDYQRINEATAKAAAEQGLKAAGKAQAMPTSAYGRLVEAERGKLVLRGVQAITRTVQDIARQVAALTGSKTAADYHERQKIAKAAAMAAAKVAEGQEPVIIKPRSSLSDIIRTAKRAPVEKMGLNEALANAGRRLDQAEGAWRQIQEHAPHQEIATTAAARQEARDAYRGTLPPAERESFDERCEAIDQIDAPVPVVAKALHQAAERQAEIVVQAQPQLVLVRKPGRSR
jgi:hypothetical protein